MSKPTEDRAADCDRLSSSSVRLERLFQVSNRHASYRLSLLSYLHLHRLVQLASHLRQDRILLVSKKGEKRWSPKIQMSTLLNLIEEIDMTEAKTTTDHEQIRRWVEERGGHPARVEGTEVEGSSGVLLIDYPGYSGTSTLEAISWDEFFHGFEENKLAFLYQDETRGDDQRRLSKLVNRDSVEEKSRAAAS